MILAIFAWFTRIGGHGDQALGGLGIWPCLTRGLLKVQHVSIAARIEGPVERNDFVLRQPLAADVEAPHLPTPGHSPEPDSFKRVSRRILVVDDNIDAARSLAKLLTLLHGQHVEVAHDGPSALERAETFHPQVVLLDISLPGMSGHEVAEQLRLRPWFEACMLVAVTGWGQEQDRATSRAAGFDYHLVKPVNQVTLRDLLDGNLRPDR